MRNIIPLIMFILFLGILGGSVIYLGRRMHYFFDTESLRPWYIIFSAVLVFMIGGLIAFTNSNSAIGSFFYKAATILMGFMMYFLMAVLLLDLIHLFVKSNPRLFGGLAIGLTALVFLLGLWNSFRTQVTNKDVAIAGLESPVRIAHLTDIHIGHFRGPKFLKQVVDKTNLQNPDIVVITGDLFDGSIRLNEKVLAPLKQLEAPAFFVNGNHDGYSGLKSVYESLQKTGVKVLRNEIVESHGLQIIGLNHMSADSTTGGMHATQEGPTMKDVLHQLNIDKNIPTLLLHHSPDGIEYANEHGVDLYLAGHTHGGQQFPVTLINEFLFKFNKGLHSYKNTQILVSEGIGTFGPPVRVGTKSEIVSINLVMGDGK